MEDSYTGDDRPEGKHFSTEIDTTIEPIEGEAGVYMLTATLDQSFLDDPDTVYPILIDPAASWEAGKSRIFVFPSLGCRFIALNDSVDTIRKNNEMLVILKNVMNNLNTRDTSRKRTRRNSTNAKGGNICNDAPALLS